MVKQGIGKSLKQIDTNWWFSMIMLNHWRLWGGSIESFPLEHIEKYSKRPAKSWSSKTILDWGCSDNASSMLEKKSSSCRWMRRLHEPEGDFGEPPWRAIIDVVSMDYSFALLPGGVVIMPSLAGLRSPACFAAPGSQQTSWCDLDIPEALPYHPRS